jgi:O-antigen ligase
VIAKPRAVMDFNRHHRFVPGAEFALFWMFIGGLAWTPFWYGSNAPLSWGANAVWFPGLAVIYEIAAAMPGKGHSVSLRALALPAGLFAIVISWGLVQSATWIPTALANPVWGMAAEALGKPLAESISVNRDLTGLALIRLITAASVFWLALQLCRDAVRARRLVWAVAAVTAVYGVYGFVALRAGQIPWLDIPAADGRMTSTFVNHNSYATYAGIGVIAAAGLLVRLCQQELINGGNWRLRLASAIEVLTGGEGAALLAMGFINLAALLLTGSRGGVLSVVIGLVVLGILVQRRVRSRGRRSIAGVVVLFGLLLTTLLMFGGVFVDNLNERGVGDVNRINVLVLTLRSIADIPLLGFGYGTFSNVFPLYRDRSISSAGTWTQAHDTYLEALQGLGVIVGAMLIVALAALALRCIKGALGRERNATAPCVASGVACLIGINAMVDFSLQIQAVTLTFMAVLGAGFSQATSSRSNIGD